jgi:hypothetical protein
MLAFFQLLLIALCSLPNFHAFEDEFLVRGPGDLHRVAIEKMMEERRANPDLKDVFGEDSNMMKRAKEYAIQRFMTKSDEALKVSVRKLQ